MKERKSSPSDTLTSPHTRAEAETPPQRTEERPREFKVWSCPIGSSSSPSKALNGHRVTRNTAKRNTLWQPLTPPKKQSGLLFSPACQSPSLSAACTRHRCHSSGVTGHLSPLAMLGAMTASEWHGAGLAHHAGVQGTGTCLLGTRPSAAQGATAFLPCPSTLVTEREQLPINLPVALFSMSEGPHFSMPCLRL